MNKIKLTKEMFNIIFKKYQNSEIDLSKRRGGIGYSLYKGTQTDVRHIVSQYYFNESQIEKIIDYTFEKDQKNNFETERLIKFLEMIGNENFILKNISLESYKLMFNALTQNSPYDLDVESTLLDCIFYKYDDRTDDWLPDDIEGERRLTVKEKEKLNLIIEFSKNNINNLNFINKDSILHIINSGWDYRGYNKIYKFNKWVEECFLTEISENTEINPFETIDLIIPDNIEEFLFHENN